MAKNKKQKQGFVIFVAIATIISLAGLTGLFGAGATPTNNQTNQQQEEPTPDEIAAATGVPCLTSEVFHLHPHLTIKIDGVEEPLPANIGIYTDCAQEIHTHEADGIIHVESEIDKGYTFQDFLNVFRVSLEQEGYVTRLTVNGEFNNNDTSFKLEDPQEILLEFTSIPSFDSTSTEQSL